MENGTESREPSAGHAPLTRGDVPPRRVADQDEARCASRRSARRSNLAIAVLAALLVASSLVSLMLGRYPINPAEAVGMLATWPSPSTRFGPRSKRRSSSKYGCPASCSRSLVGCSLAAAGAAYHGHVPKPARLARHPGSLPGRRVRRSRRHSARLHVASHLGERVSLLHRRRFARAAHRQPRPGQPPAHRGARRRHGELGCSRRASPTPSSSPTRPTSSPPSPTGSWAASPGRNGATWPWRPRP